MKLYFATLVMRDKAGKQIGEPHPVAEPFAFADRLACEARIEKVSRDESYLEIQRRIILAQGPAPVGFTLTTEMRVSP